MKMENNYYYKTKLRVNEHYREIYNVYVIYVNVKALTRKNRKIYKSPVDCFFFSSFECKTGKKTARSCFSNERVDVKNDYLYTKAAAIRSAAIGLRESVLFALTIASRYSLD